MLKNISIMIENFLKKLKKGIDKLDIVMYNVYIRLRKEST